ncbi:MAG: hypothetical protein IH588_10775 [Anaerolineales bacterium]|nr:hypothetical protein [Anaerolineales bacterium]
MSKKLFSVLVSLALVSLACGFLTNIPAAKTPGPDVTDQISVAPPDGDARLTLNFGGGNLVLAPGATKLVEGSATYNIPELKPVIKTEGGDVSITVGDYKTNGVSSFNQIKNEWNLKLGAAPMELTINSGAYEGTFDLGGLSLTNLTIKDGAAQMTADFSSPNPEKLSVLSYKTGASTVTLKNLGNANFEALSFEGGAGKYKLDFGGTFQRAGSVTIHLGLSSLELVIPSGIVATVKVSGGMSNMQTPSGWNKNGETYTQEGSGPALTIVIEMGAGSVQITQ